MSTSEAKKIVALYARSAVTNASRREYAIEPQLEALRVYCDQRGWIIHESYTDAGVSAMDHERPGLRALMDAAHMTARPFDAIVVCDVSRLARSLPQTALITAELRELGVELVSLEEAVPEEEFLPESLLRQHLSSFSPK